MSNMQLIGAGLFLLGFVVNGAIVEYLDTQGKSTPLWLAIALGASLFLIAMGMR